MSAQCFNPRAHAGRDLTAVSAYDVSVVSIHAPMRGATGNARPGREASLFQSTRPCGARHTLGGKYKSVDMFQSTRPCGARLKYDQYRAERICFNPRAHAGRDHTPLNYTHNYEQVSIHAPMRGATRCVCCSAHRDGCFNPRAHAGRDPSGKAGYIELYKVSIHAPMRGATLLVFSLRLLLLFQSTRPCGARHVVLTAGITHQNVSIHAPMRGATSQRLQSFLLKLRFNPRAHAGRDPC